VVHAALDDAAFDMQLALEYLEAAQESRNVLPPYVFGEIPQFIVRRAGRTIEQGIYAHVCSRSWLVQIQ
jgi:hypothetical protein